MDKSDFVIVGGVACGPKTAATLARRLPNAKITLFQKDEHLSYAVCGLPYLASGEVGSFRELTLMPHGVPRDAEFFSGSKGFAAITGAEVTKIDRRHKTVTVRTIQSGETVEHGYGKLVLATGALPVGPSFPVTDDPRIRSFYKPDDAMAFRRMAEEGKVGKAAIVGGGFIGCELVEATAGLWGIETFLAEKENQVLPYVLDYEMAVMVQRYLAGQDVAVMTDCRIENISLDSQGKPVISVANRDRLTVDYVFLALGARPNSELARACGLEIGPTGGIRVNDRMQTSDPDVYAGGDCVETVHRITGREFYLSMGSLANRHGRVMAENLAGGDVHFPGALGTCFLKVFDINVGSTGLTWKQAEQHGFDTRCVWGTFPDKPDYHPEKGLFVVKMVYDGKTEKLLGLQAVGMGDITRRVDVFASFLQNGASLNDLFNFEHGYAPPYSEALDPLHQMAGMARAQQKGTTFLNPGTNLKAAASSLLILDVRETEEATNKPLPPSIADCGALILNIPLGRLRARLGEVGHDRKTVVVCQRGSRSYQAALMLRAAGFEQVKILAGGLQTQQ